MSHLLNDKGVCRTAPATPGMLNSDKSKELRKALEFVLLSLKAYCITKSYHVGARVAIFTESALRPIQSTSRDVRLSVCLCHRKHPLPEVMETSGQIASVHAITLFLFSFSFYDFGRTFFLAKNLLAQENVYQLNLLAKKKVLAKRTIWPNQKFANKKIAKTKVLAKKTWLKFCSGHKKYVWPNNFLGPTIIFGQNVFLDNNKTIAQNTKIKLNLHNKNSLPKQNFVKEKCQPKLSFGKTNNCQKTIVGQKKIG